MRITGKLIDLHQRRIYPAAIVVGDGFILSVEEVADAPAQFILPGFIDAHVHIESSMLSPAAFAQMAVRHGTVATVSDPHEIANVCGAEGVRWMIDNARSVPFKAFFGAPSCVPATGFETSGAVLDAAAVGALLASPDIWYLAEMMNYPGVLQGNAMVAAKIAAAKHFGKPVDGHAPGLRGDDALRYAAAGISTDHECTSLDEALDKIRAGMHILIREGSAARNFEALHPLLATHPDKVMLCSDDKHPDELQIGHINLLVRRAMEKGHNLFDVLRAACVNPVLHYGLPVGLLRRGDPADFIVVPDDGSWRPSHTYIIGRAAALDGHSTFDLPDLQPINHFKALPRREEDFVLPVHQDTEYASLAIVARDGQLTTGAELVTLHAQNGHLCPSIGEDVLKLVVINRYEASARPAIAFVRGFGLRRGAIASSVAHDCHNIIAVGADDASICAAVNEVIGARGGISVACATGERACLPLPVAGLMSDRGGDETGSAYAALSQKARALGSTLEAPFMTLSFMALLVIPSLKLSDKGLFDGERFCFVDVVH